MKQLRMSRILHHHSVKILLLLALTGCTMPTPAGTPGAPTGSTPPAATAPLTATQSSTTDDLPAGDLPTDGGDQMATRVEFAPTTTATTLSGTLTAGSEQHYALAASTGQTMTVQTVGEAGPVNFTVYGPDGASWTGEVQTDVDHHLLTQVMVPATGDYLVTLTVPTAGVETNYEVAFAFGSNPVERIAFANGETTERRGALADGARVQQYLLSANSGMTLTVDATSDPAPLSMTIESPSGNQQIPEMMGADGGYTIGHQFALTEPGYYLVTLAKGEEAPATDYTVTFTLESAVL